MRVQFSNRVLLSAIFAFAALTSPAQSQDTAQVEASDTQSELIEAAQNTAQDTATQDTPTESKPAVVTAAELKEAGGSLPEIIESPDVVPGLKALQDRGIQGQSVVEFIVQADGTITDKTISTPSKSEELDEVALGLVDLFVAKPALDAEGQPVAVSAKMPLNFWKDSLVNGTLTSKTCADFVIDADWYLSVNPDASIKDMRVWLMTSGTYISAFFNSSNSSASMADRFKNAPRPDPDELYLYCKQKPKKLFFKTFKKLG